MKNLHIVSEMEDGFTLVELMIALVVFTFGLLGIVGMFVTGIQGNVQGKRTTEATALAQGRLEFIINNNRYTDIDTYAGTENNLDATGEVVSNGPYTRTTTITTIAPTINGTPDTPPYEIEAKEVTVEVSWFAKRFGDAQTVSKKVTMRAVKAQDR